MSKGKTEVAWETLFNELHILDQINAQGIYRITSTQIKDIGKREPRLMAKFDHEADLPEIFTKNSLAILPVTRGDYVIAHFDAYHKLESSNKGEFDRSLIPDFIQSLDYDNINSETIALNCAVASGIVADFLNEDKLFATVSGRMGSGNFSFNIDNRTGQLPYTVQVNNSQIEIDAAYEGINSLAVLEAKLELSNDFLVRQLYYPYRVWEKQIKKQVRPLFFVYSNGIFRLYEYKFQTVDNYSSLTLIRQKNYLVENRTITSSDILSILDSTQICDESKVPFPQANTFDRVVNICELLNENSLNKEEVTEQYEFVARQTNYYTDACKYLGLLEKQKDNEGTSVFVLNRKGKDLFKKNLRDRNLAFCKYILEHKIFNDVLREYFKYGRMPDTDKIIEIMKASNAYHVGKQSTYIRRASTIRGWINWIVGLIND